MCEYLTQYFEEYQKRGLSQTYGGLASFPLEGQGGGCAAFGMSFLQVAGFDEKKFDDTWARTLAIPYRYITNEQISAQRGFFSFMMRDYSGSWARTDEPSISIRFWDPQLLFDYLGELADRPLLAGEGFDYIPQDEESPLEIIFDRTNHEPTGLPFWRQ